MKTLEEIKRDFTIFKTFKGSGHYQVSMNYQLENLGDYLETDMQQIDDISEMQADGFENELCNNETFEEVFETTLRRISRNNNNTSEIVDRIDELLEIYF